jgi:dihydroorotase-like cyclic amidohydrolase
MTAFVDMPLNSTPATIDVEAFDRKVAAASAAARIDFALWGGLVPGNLDQIEAMHRRGAIGFKAFMSETGMADFRPADDLTLLEGMRRAAELGYDADLALVDVSHRWTLTAAELRYRHPFSALVGQPMRGAVRRALTRGRTVIADGELMPDVRGRLLKPTGA